MTKPHALPCSALFSASPESHAFQAHRLSQDGTCIVYRDDQGSHFLDLAELLLAPTVGHPHVSRVSDEPNYVATAQAIADSRVINAKTDTPAPRMITRQLYLYRHALDWLRLHGVYRLADATADHTEALVREYAAGGWSGALDLTSRWHRVLDELTPDELSAGFHYRIRGGAVKHIETLLQPFWRSRLGWGGILPLPSAVKTRIESMVSSPLSPGWATRTAFVDGPPGQLVVRNTLGWLNHWCTLPDHVDRLRHRVAGRPTTVAVRLSLKSAGRTENLTLDDAVRLLKAALRLLYDVSPGVVGLYQHAKEIQSSTKPCPDLSVEWLQSQPIVHELSALLGKPVVRWLASGSYAKQIDTYTVDQLLSAIQGACGVLLAAMNARRQREVCDARLGVRAGDLMVIDDELGIYQTQFYIEKTYFDRHTFYINRTSADALRCLDALKAACAPESATIAPSRSLFACGRRNQKGLRGEAHFSFSADSGRTRSLSAFLEFALGDPKQVSSSAHMFRRFYAILYYHQYEHAELRALKQHLRHLDVAMTRVYVTDPASRPLSEQIRATLGSDRFTVANEQALNALDEEQLDLNASMAEVEREKLEQAIEQVLEGTPTAGGFSRIVRKLYRQLSTQLTASNDLVPKVADRLAQRGYRVRPMAHGQCHAPDTKRNLKARCERAGDLAREQAGARHCQTCPYHFNNEAYLQNLREDLRRLDHEAYDVLLPPMQQARARFEYANLDRLINVTAAHMDANAQHMITLRAQQSAS